MYFDNVVIISVAIYFDDVIKSVAKMRGNRGL